MFLTKVILGHSYIAQRGDSQMKRPPCVHHCTGKCEHKKSEFYDSVMGTHVIDRKTNKLRRLLFREFIIFEKRQCYPTYIITYVRKWGRIWNEMYVLNRVCHMLVQGWYYTALLDIMTSRCTNFMTISVCVRAFVRSCVRACVCVCVCVSVWACERVSMWACERVSVWACGWVAGWCKHACTLS